MVTTSVIQYINVDSCKKQINKENVKKKKRNTRIDNNCY